ncbi:WD repeat-containing protein [Plectosphaerella cucumerina]|uniref:WD repeat-containing protein n=1 Tax=Plectosphaerella cucumerina TaxID=40658 RepID=A0A8K0TF93_9PEZI|nr:WD repeat-containing protein [Plectosphaerella cucumerina]
MYSRDNKIMRKLLGKATPDNSTDTTPTIGTTSASNLPQSYRPSATQYVNYDAKYPIYSVDASSDHRAALLGSGHVLKTIHFDGLQVKEGVDVRAAIVAASNPIKSAASSGASDQLSVKDAKFANDTTIFTACSNGKIFSYDIGRIATGGSAMDCVQMREDSRQVNTIDVNPHWVSTLLSGSQDGYIRYFDIRAPVQSRAGGMTYKARASFKCNADGVRHAKWSPRDGYQLACGTENGAVLKWDVRKPTTPLLRITAHEKHCNSISWHPDGNHLISAGWDQRCAVWDLSKTADKRQKPKWVIHTPAPVSSVAWRPALWSASAQGKRAAQIAVSYESASVARFGIKAVQIWDLARPSLPFKELDWFSSPPSSMVWLDQDILWTVGDDCQFHQCDLAFAPKTVDRIPTSSIAFSSRGDVAMFLDERPHQRPRPTTIHHQEVASAARSVYGSSPTAPMLSISRSDSEDDVMGSFIGPRRRAGGRKRRSSLRSMPALSTTPPSGPNTADEVFGLEQAMKITGSFKSQQAMAVGRIPSAVKVNHYQYLTQCYLETLQRELPNVAGSKPLVERVALILETFACAAENVEQFRLAQTWRILAYAMNLLLTRRAQFHLQSRLGQFAKVPSMAKLKDMEKAGELKVLTRTGEIQALRRTSAVSATLGASLTARSLLSEEIESTSNVPTPVARPVREDDLNNNEYRPGMKLTPVIELDNFSLPPAASTFQDSPRKRLDSAPLSVTSQESESTQMSSTEGYDFYDTDAIATAIDVPEVPEALPQKPPGVVRHNSDDSFSQMFSMSENSRKASQPETSQPLRIETVEEHEDEDRGEYESRIRGREIPSPEATKPPPRRRPLQPESPEEVFMISQTTMDSDPIGSEAPSQPESFRLGHSFEDHAPLHIGVVSSSPAVTVQQTHHRLDSTPTIIESDYFPWADDPPYPFPLPSAPAASTGPPLDPYVLIERALEFELQTSVYNAAALMLLLKPLLPDSVIDPARAASILRTHHIRLGNMRLFVEAALLRNLCVQGWPEGMPDWGDNYTAIFGPAQQGVKGGLLCPSCRKPREVDPKKGPGALWQCDRCKVNMAPCAVCGHREASAAVLPVTEGLSQSKNQEEEIMSVWWYCPGCAHGGHATCIQGWHAPHGLDEPASADGFDGSDGCCPLDGCGHACLPGKWRDEKTLLRSDEVGRAAVEKSRTLPPRKSSSATNSPSILPMGGAPLRDGIEVPQSRAVESVRETLAGAAAAWAGGGGRPAHSSMGGGHQAAATPSAGILSSSPGRAAERGDRERRKSVKFVPTER